MVTTILVVVIIYLLAAGGENGWYNRKARDGFGRLNSKFNSKGRYSELGYGKDNQYMNGENPYGSPNDNNDFGGGFGNSSGFGSGGGFGNSGGFGSDGGFGSGGFGNSSGFGSSGFGDAPKSDSGFGGDDFGFGKPNSNGSRAFSRLRSRRF